MQNNSLRIMEKNEHAILLDIPSGGKNGKYHSAVLTTYAIDLIHFDNQLLNMLHRKQICSINVFADTNQMDKSMEYVSPIYMRNIGKEYSITPISAVGAFHPKINFFVGDDAVLVVFGTGNLTVTGHGKNHEAFTGFMIDETETTHRPLIEECWRYISQFTNQCGDFDSNRVLRDIPENCTFLDSSFNIIPHSMCKVQEGLEAALLYNESKSGILQQISHLVPLNEVQTITVLSPYFDEYGESLIALSRLCPNSTVNILIHKDCVLPPSKMAQNDRIHFYDFSDTKRGKISFKTYERQLHAKILHFKTKDSEYCMVGSANATLAGLGTITHRGINEEFGVLYYSTKLDFLSLLGLKTKKRIDVPTNRARHFNEESSETKIRLRLLSAYYESGKLSVYSKEEIADGMQLAIDNGLKTFISEFYHVAGNRYDIDIKLDKIQYTCYLVDNNNNCISNKLFINWTELLATTNPSKMSRNLNRFISRIENEGYNGMEVADMLSDVMWDLVNDAGENVSPKIKVSSENKKEFDASLPDIKYNPDFDNDDAKSSRILQIDRTSRLIECIEESIRKKIRLIDDAILDEEEEGSAETSNNRDIEEQEDIHVSKKQVKDYGDLSTSLLMKYQKMISKRYEQVKVTENSFMTKDDLNFFSLSMFAAMEICYLNKFRYKFDQIPNALRSCCQKQFYESLERSISDIGLASLEKFVRFCNSMKLPIQRDEKFNKVATRTMKYVILYGTLFYKLSNIETKRVLNNRLLEAVDSLVGLFGKPSIDILTMELEPLSERYDYVFRMSHIEYMLKLISR